MVYRSGPEKDRLEAWQMFYCGCCLALADCGGGGGWAVDVLAVRWWWLEERRLVLVCPQVKTVVNLLVAHHRVQGSLKVLICWVSFLSL